MSQPEQTNQLSSNVSLAELIPMAPPSSFVQETEQVSSVMACFEKDPACVAILVLERERFINVVSREALAAQFTKAFFREIYHAKPIGRLLADWPIPPLILSATTSINDAISMALQRPAKYRYEPLVVLNDAGRHSVLDLHFVLFEECRLLERTLQELNRQREATAAVEREREQLHHRLVAASREAGRAEVATGVLHNVGNVLNSVNTSAAVISRTLQQSKVPTFVRLAGLIRERSDDIAAFLSTDERGKQIPDYLPKLAELLAGEQAKLSQEMTEMVRSLEHIKQIVQMQQSHAKVAAVIEEVDPAELIEDAVRVNLSSFDRHQVKVEREIESRGKIFIDKHKTLGILINLISNAKNAVIQNDPQNRQIRLAFQYQHGRTGGAARFTVTDNGVGIPNENLTRIFSHGFTTRSEGHGFGLHSAANAAKEMNGSLMATSEGPGLGAVFTLIVQDGDMNATSALPLKVSA